MICVPNVFHFASRWRPIHLALWALGILAAGQGVAGDDSNGAQPTEKLNILICGAHPDDPESGAGGVISLLSREGHAVTVMYAVTFRAGRTYFDRPEKEVRREEARRACEVLGAKPVFLDYAAGEFYADQSTLKSFGELLQELRPDIVLTHWPVDTHPDHEAISTLVWRSYQRQGGWNLYYFEVNAGHQTLAFTPNVYFDIAAVRERKREALMCHTSQAPETIWSDHHEPMQLRRGQECGVGNAEAFLLVEAKPGCPQLPLPALTRRN